MVGLEPLGNAEDTGVAGWLRVWFVERLVGVLGLIS